MSFAVMVLWIKMRHDGEFWMSHSLAATQTCGYLHKPVWALPAVAAPIQEGSENGELNCMLYIGSILNWPRKLWDIIIT